MLKPHDPEMLAKNIWASLGGRWEAGRTVPTSGELSVSLLHGSFLRRLASHSLEHHDHEKLTSKAFAPP